MSKMWTLTKVLLKTNLLGGTNASKNAKKKNKWLGWAGIGLLLVFVICCLGIPIIYALDSILEVLAIKNLLLTAILPLAGITTIVFSIFSVVSVFYLSKDSEHLLPLPLKPRDIMMSKFLVSLVNEYYILFMFILPCLIGVGVGTGAGFLYYFYMILIFLLLPIIPSVIVTLIILLVTRFTGIVKNKDLFMYFSMGLILVFSFGYTYIIESFIAIDPSNIGGTLQGIESQLIPYCKLIFPFYNSGSTALINYDNLNGAFALVTFIALNLLALIVIYFVGDKLYLKTLIVDKGSKKKNKVIEESLVGDEKRAKGAFYWLLKKEWLVVKRTPVFMLNIVIIVFLMPVIFIASFVFSYLQESGGSLLELNSEQVLQFIDMPLTYMIVLLVAVFFTCSSIAASTSISREGSNAWVMKVIPVSYFKQINVKVFFAVVLDMVGVMIVGIIPIIMFKIPFYYVLCIFVPLLIIVVLLNYFNILLDLRKPRLNWSEESVAVKQNINGLISILMTIAVCGILGVFAFVVYWFNLEIDVVVISLIISLLCGSILAFVIYMFYKNSNKLLENVD